MLKTLTKVAVVLSLFVFSGVAKAADPIRIPVLNWSSQIVMANVMAQVFEEMGHTVELVPAESASRYEAVRIGDLHVAHETWESTMALPFYEAMDKGGLIDAGSHDLITFEEMGVPNWVIDEGFIEWGGYVVCAQDNGSFEKGWVFGTNNNVSFAVSTKEPDDGNGVLTYVKAAKNPN